MKCLSFSSETMDLKIHFQAKIYKLLKFIFAKKATKFDNIFIIDLMLCNKCQIHGEDFRQFLWPSWKIWTLPEFTYYKPKIFWLFKCRFLKKSFIMNAPLVSCPFPVITFGWVQIKPTKNMGATGLGVHAQAR